MLNDSRCTHWIAIFWFALTLIGCSQSTPSEPARPMVSTIGWAAIPRVRTEVLIGQQESVAPIGREEPIGLNESVPLNWSSLESAMTMRNGWLQTHATKLEKRQAAVAAAEVICQLSVDELRQEHLDESLAVIQKEPWGDDVLADAVAYTQESKWDYIQPRGGLFVTRVSVRLAVASRASGYSRDSGSSNEVPVSAYMKRDGPFVPAHWRTAPNGTREDNWSNYGNVNPHNGRRGTRR